MVTGMSTGRYWISLFRTAKLQPMPEPMFPPPSWKEIGVVTGPCALGFFSVVYWLEERLVRNAVAGVTIAVLVIWLFRLRNSASSAASTHGRGFLLWKADPDETLLARIGRSSRFKGFLMAMAAIILILILLSFCTALVLVPVQVG